MLRRQAVVGIVFLVVIGLGILSGTTTAAVHDRHVLKTPVSESELVKDTQTTQVATGVSLDGSPDYTITSSSKFVYYDQRTFEDKNGDGQVTIQIKGTIDFVDTSTKQITYTNSHPVIIRGTNQATVKNLEFLLDTKQSITVAVTQLTVVNGGGSIRTGGDVLVTESNFTGVKRPTIRTPSQVVIRGTTFKNADPFRTRYQDQACNRGCVASAGTTLRVLNSTFLNMGGSYGNALWAKKSVTIRRTTFETVDSNTIGISPGTVTATNVRVEAFDGEAVFKSRTVRLRKSTFVRIENMIADVVGDGRDTRTVAITGTTIQKAELVTGYADLITVTNSTIEDSGNFYEVGKLVVKESTIRGSGETRPTLIARDFNTLVIANSRLENMGAIGLKGDRITIRDSVLVNTRFLNADVIVLTRATVYNPRVKQFMYAEAGEIENYSLKKVNFIAAKKPLIKTDAMKLPDKGVAFVDWQTDTEPWGDWTGDPFWSATRPFSNYKKVRGFQPGPAITTPTPTPVLDSTSTVKETRKSPASEQQEAGQQSTTTASPISPAQKGGKSISLPGFTFSQGSIAILVILLVLARRRRK